MAKSREAERALAPGEIPQEGCDVLISGKDGKSKCLHVTPAFMCSDWLKRKLDDSGHETLIVSGLTDLAKSKGWESCEVKNGSKAPKPTAKAEEKAGKPLPVAMKAGA
jgi:hypothetical protein